MKDWIGNKKATFVTLGASSHSDSDRESNDYYATDPRTIDELFSVETFTDLPVWEPACGEGHLSKEIEKYTSVKSSDLINRGFGEVQDFLTYTGVWEGHIITNPPYKYAQDFVEKSLDIIKDGSKVAMFLKITFLEGQKRLNLFKKYPPKVVYVYSSRRQCGINGKFVGSSAACYAWFVWEKGVTTETVVRWIK